MAYKLRDQNRDAKVKMVKGPHNHLNDFCHSICASEALIAFRDFFQQRRCQLLFNNMTIDIYNTLTVLTNHVLLNNNSHFNRFKHSRQRKWRKHESKYVRKCARTDTHTCCPWKSWATAAKASEVSSWGTEGTVEFDVTAATGSLSGDVGEPDRTRTHLLTAQL